MEKIINFDWKIKEKPEDFIVKEIADFDIQEDGNFFLYLLIKRNLNTKDVTDRYKLNYAGLKDKNAITFQFVSSDKYLGKILKEKPTANSFFALIFEGKIRKKIKIGNLKGNKFSINLKGKRIQLKDCFINYYDLQRIERNKEKGKKLIKEIKPGIKWKNLKWRENFYIEAYLSHLWNKSLMIFLKENFKGYLVAENQVKYFFPYTNYQYLMENFKKFWAILGYKVKLDDIETEIYRYVLKKEGFNYDDFIEKLYQLRIKGDYRKTFLKAEDLYIKNNRINFFLPKGAYATMFLKSLVVE